MQPNVRDGHCSRLQEKVTKDAQHIKSLGSIIDKLRLDIGGLQKTIDTVKNTQVTSCQAGSSLPRFPNPLLEVGWGYSVPIPC